MKLNVYSIFDSAAGAYARPFFLQSDGQALRAFQDIATDNDHEIGKHPEDYSLARIGTYDDQKGTLHPENVEHIATGMEMVAKARQIAPGHLDAWDKAEVPANAGGTN